MATSLLFRSPLHHLHRRHQFGLAKPNAFSPSPTSSFSPPGKGRFLSLRSIKMQGMENTKKKVFVAGATGSTEKKIVDQLLARGFAVKAGVNDLKEAKSAFSLDNPSLQFVQVEVTDSSNELAKAIGDDTKAVVYATEVIKVDHFSTVNLIEACQKCGVDRFILISSIFLSFDAVEQISVHSDHISYHNLGEAFGAKQHMIRMSGINYTIIRPVGLRDDPPSGNIVMGPEDTLFKGSISRDQVAEVAVEALIHPESHYKIVEIVAEAEAPKRPFDELFRSIRRG
ncbi:uncharacterized protein At2g34460, chloroplastic-like [Punica granatum]|uniref:Uncharacterized protein At2g34460, chloroplastic-like n=1 Tax=Punica granatum TaxID=22663 RepID=A0A6P8DAX1_PUNGR|nr:uncharacterized protein At2g34460, chloroplastic-like [Punica granatum]